MLQIYGLIYFKSSALRFIKNILEMVKNDICLGIANRQNAFFFKLSSLAIKNPYCGDNKFWNKTASWNF